MLADQERSITGGTQKHRRRHTPERWMLAARSEAEATSHGVAAVGKHRSLTYAGAVNTGSVNR